MFDGSSGGNGSLLSLEVCVFIIHEERVAVMTVVFPFLCADFLQELVRDGLVVGDGDHRDVTVHWGMGFFTSLPTVAGKPSFFCS